MNDRIEQDRFHLLEGTVLSCGDIAQGPSVGRLMRQSQRQIEDVRRNAIRVGHVIDVHPGANVLVLMVMPVDDRADRAHGKIGRAAHYQQQD